MNFSSDSRSGPFAGCGGECGLAPSGRSVMLRAKGRPMDESQWLALPLPRSMLRLLGRSRSKRKVRLFAAACWRCRCRDMTSFDRLRRVIDQAERMADGEIRSERDSSGWVLLRTNIYAMALDTIETVSNIRGKGNVSFVEQAALVRDIFGNPFRPFTFSTAWRTDTVLTLARQMYESREFGAMPILADALQDAGCEDVAVLDHCRAANAAHVRGCWVVDLVLGKE